MLLVTGISAENIFVFGDSHCRELQYISGYIDRYKGPTTMHRIGRDGLQFLNLLAEGVNEGDVALFVFGEIDIRSHVVNQRDSYKRSIEEILDTLAKNYIKTIIVNRSFYNDILCVVCSVTPPTDGFLNEQYPVSGSIEERVQFTQRLNKKLSKLCHRNQIAFLDVYDDYATSEGILNPDLSDGNVHISPLHIEPIRNKLEKILYSKATF